MTNLARGPRPARKRIVAPSSMAVSVPVVPPGMQMMSRSTGQSSNDMLGTIVIWHRILRVLWSWRQQCACDVFVGKLDAEISRGDAISLGVTEYYLDGADIAGAPIDQHSRQLPAWNDECGHEQMRGMITPRRHVRQDRGVHSNASRAAGQHQPPPATCTR